jgi:hypothetical protein
VPPLSVLQQPSRGSRYRRYRRGPRFGWRALLVLVVVVILIVYIVPTPWALHIGGKFTPLEEWDGVASVSATNGGHYVLFTHLEAGLLAGGPGHLDCSFAGGCDTLHGNAKLCTERGATYSFSLHGAVHTWWSTDGASTSIDLTGKNLPSGWVVAFKGKWAGSVLPLADTDNSFTEVFTRGGAVRRATSTADAGIAHGTLRNASSSTFDRACRALAS